MQKNCSGNCGSCGSCSGCSGCAGELLLSEPEISMLDKLGQIPFLPVARRAEEMTPVYLEESDKTPEEYSLVLQCLEKKGLIDMDYEHPLVGADMSAYKAYPIHGSMALTARGQTVVEMLGIQGIL